jgi:hypothetical protein
MTDAPPDVVIRMSEETLGALAASGHYLYGLSAVRSADAAGRPAAWLQTRGYAMHTRVRPPAAFRAFTSMSAAPLVDGARVHPGFHAPAEPGQTLVVELAGGGGEMRERGAPGAVSLLNTTAVQLTGGLACLVDGEATPIHAAPLYGGGLQVIAPLPTLLLFVSPWPSPPGTLVSTSTGPGVLLHLVSGAECRLEFHVNRGWSWEKGVRATPVPAQSDLVGLLVEYPDPGTPDAGLV